MVLISLISHMHNNNDFRWGSWIRFHYWWSWFGSIVNQGRRILSRAQIHAFHIAGFSELRAH